jgi:spore coat protein H
MARIGILFLALTLALGCGDFNGGGGGGSGGDGIDVGGGDGGGGGDDGGTGYGYGNDGPPPVPAPALVEDRSVYDQDTLDIVDLHVTILPGGATLDEVNADDDPYNILKTEALCEVSEPGFRFEDGSTTATATFRVRGHSTRRAAQKSYRIRLDDDDNLWRNHEVIQLNKHPYDVTRMRNKLSFDLLRSLDNMASMRTQFVRLWIDGESHGLYTLIERYDERFLKAHGLDKGGHLYKAEFFEQHRYAGHLKNPDDPEFDEAKFEEILEIKGRDDDHTKLLAMLDDLNDESVDINTVVKRHFERKNFLTWWATNILLFNIDTNSQNYYLYSPRTTTAWYFLPWDYDGGWDFYRQPRRKPSLVITRYKEGISNWWNNTLPKRFIKDPKNLADLIAKVEELKDEFYTVERIRGLTEPRRTLILNDLAVKPDFWNLPTVSGIASEMIAEVNREIDRLADIPEQSCQKFLATLERPMPVFLDDPEVKGGRIYLRWDESYDLQGDGLTYDVLVADDYHFEPEDVVYERPGLTTTSHDFPVLPAGTYYFRLVIRDTKDPVNNWMYPYNNIQTEDANFEGMRRFTVE